MDFFDTDQIEGKTRIKINAGNIDSMVASKKIEHKMQVIEWLDEGNAVDYFPQLLILATYPIKAVNEAAFKTILRWLPWKESETDYDRQTFELLLFKIMPWVNEAAAKLSLPSPSGGETPGMNVEELNEQICACLDYLYTSLPVDPLNMVILAGLKYSNFKVQVAACQCIKHFYLCHPDKTLLELSEIFDALIANNSIGTKELKKHALECMMAIYRVFGETVEGFLEKLNNTEKIDLVRQGASQLKLREKPRTASQSSQAKQEVGGRKKENPLKLPIPTPSPMPSASNRGSMLKSPHVNSKTSIGIGIPGGSSQTIKSTSPTHSNGQHHMMMRSTINAGSLMGKSHLQPCKDIIPSYNFDEYRHVDGSDLLLAFDDKWCKKLQIMKKEEPILEELNIVQQMVESQKNLLYFPEINKTFLTMLKNYLMDANNKIVSATIPIIRALVKATTRSLQDAFPLFYPELIEKLKSKSKQDDMILDSLIYLSSNVSLPNFLRRIQKDFLEKNSTLRLNLIEVLCTILENKGNYDPAETSRAGNVLSELKKFAETELSKDLNIPVRKASERIVAVILDMYSEEVQSATGEFIEPSFREDPNRRSMAMSTAKKGSYQTLPDPLKKSSTAEKTASSGMIRNSSGITPATITESIMNPMISSRSSTNIKPSQSIIGQSAVPLQMPAKMLQIKNQEKAPKFSTLGGGNLKSSGQNISLNDTLGPGLKTRGATIADITEDLNFEQGIEILEKSSIEKKELGNKQKLAEVFELLATKIMRDNDTDRLITQLTKVREDLEPIHLVSIILTTYNIHRYFSPSLLRNFLPNLLRISEMNMKYTGSTVARRTASAGKLESGDKRLVALMDCFIQFYGPVYFFEVFEETMYSRDLFQSKEAEPLFNLFEGFLVKISAELHPVIQILSLIRGFIYLNSSQAVTMGLGELVFILSSIYGKENFRYIKKEFELANLKEKVIDISKWPKITHFEKPEALEKIAQMKFKDKIISEVKDLTAYFKSLLSTTGGKGDPTLLRELLQTCTRNFIYNLGEKENLRFVDYLAEKFTDNNQAIQKMAVQTLALHFNSAKTVFKFSQLFYNNITAMFRHKNPEIRELALSSGFYIAKQDSKIFRLLCQEMADGNDETRLDILYIIMRLMNSEKKFITSFELTTNFPAIVDFLMNKKARLREEGEKLVKILFTHFEKKDFVTLISKEKINNRKSLTDIIEKIIEGGKIGSEGAAVTPIEITVLGSPSEEQKFVVKNLDKFPEDISKCKTIREIKRYAERHLDPAIFSKLFDVNIQNVLGALKDLLEGLTSNANLAVKSFVFIFKLLNLLIEAETKQNDVSRAMADTLATMIKLRKNSPGGLSKQEKWALCEFLLTLNKTKFEKKFLVAGTKLSIGLMQTAEEKSMFATLVERCDRKFYMTYLPGVPTIQTGSGTGDSMLKKMETGTEYDPDYDMTTPVMEDDDPNDPNLLDLKYAIADQSSIKYERADTYGSGKGKGNISHTEQKGGAERPSTLKSKKKEIGKGLMSSGSSNEENKDIDRDSDKRASPSFPGRELGEEQFEMESPVFGSRVGANSNVTSPGIRFPKDVRGTFAIFPRSVSRPEFIPNRQLELIEGRPMIDKMTKNFSTHDLNIKKASTGDQNRSDDNIFKLSPMMRSHAGEAKGFASTQATLNKQVPLPEEINSADQAIKVFTEGTTPSLAEAIMFIREAADEIDSSHIQKLLPNVNEYIEKHKPNERVTGSIIDMLHDVFSKADLTDISLRELIRTVVSSLPR